MTLETSNILEKLKYTENEILAIWTKKAKISDNDPFREEIIKNGLVTYRLLMRYLEKNLSLDELTNVCYKIASERIQANINIADFVYNSNMASTEVMSYIGQQNVTLAEYKEMVNNVNLFFDHFIYYTVERYNDLKDSDLLEKESYIEQTHKDRLTILGQMSASFVHEFRNPLTSVMGFIKILKEQYPNLEYVDIISHELDELNYRISQFLHISKKEPPLEKMKKLYCDILQEVHDFLYPSLISHNVDVQFYIDESCVFLGHVNELKQVFLNILMNGLDALESQEARKIITIEVKAVRDEAHVIISNNGPQIAKDKLQSIFEPFVTTKTLGTGIGLFVCKQIVEKHSGAIICRSTPLETSFIMKFPLYLERGQIESLPL